MFQRINVREIIIGTLIIISILIGANMILGYELEFEKTVKLIKEKNEKKVLIHLPDGLKTKANVIQERLENETDAQVFIWAGSNFGACDIPIEVERLGIGLIIHYGHTEWK